MTEGPTGGIEFRCDVCFARGTPGRVLRFNLTRTMDGTTKGVGSLYLCGACWARIAKPRMRKRAAA